MAIQVIGSILKAAAAQGGKRAASKAGSQAALNRNIARKNLAKLIRENTGQRANVRSAERIYENMGANERTREMDYYYNEARANRYDFSKSEYKTNVEESYSRLINVNEYLVEHDYDSQIYDVLDSETQERKNKMFQQQINESTKSEGMSLLDKRESKSFYTATQDLWKDSSAADGRNDIILKKAGVSDLQTLYDLITKKSKAGFEDTMGLDYRDFGFQDEESFKEFLNYVDSNIDLRLRREVVTSVLKGTLDEAQQDGSPTYINRIVSRLAAALNNV